MLSGLLGGKRSAFSGALEADTAGRTCADCVAIRIRNRNQSIVERCLYVDYGLYDILFYLFLCSFCHYLKNLK